MRRPSRQGPLPVCTTSTTLLRPLHPKGKEKSFSLPRLFLPIFFGYSNPDLLVVFDRQRTANCFSIIMNIKKPVPATTIVKDYLNGMVLHLDKSIANLAAGCRNCRRESQAEDSHALILFPSSGGIMILSRPTLLVKAVL